VVSEKVKGVCLTPAEVEAHDIKLGDHDVGISETSIPDETSVATEDVGALERPSPDDTPLAEEDVSILERPGGDEISDEGEVICVPTGQEQCFDNIDNDCNGLTDEEGALGCVVYYKDADKDGFGVTEDSKCLCEATTPYTARQAGDCDDSNAQAYPNAVEVCSNNIDDNCNGQTDEAGCQACATYYKDQDGDGYGVTGDTLCLSKPTAPYIATRGGDCDDNDARVHPGGSACGIDGDCDGSLLDVGELCDDGNSVRWDGCTDCRYLEFQVNTWTTDDQSWPSIVSLSNGGFVVVWVSYGQDGSYFGVYGQRFDSNGNKVGSEFYVNTWTTTDQVCPSITSLSNGGFVVVWQSDEQDGSFIGVYGQRFDSSGNKVGSEFQVNTWTTDWQDSPSITTLSNGGFVVVWQSDGQDGSWDGVYGQRFDPNGNKVGREFQVNTWTTDDQENPSITSLSNGGFVVVWESGCTTGACAGQDGSSWGVYGQRFDSSGNKVGSEFQVNTWTTDWQDSPSITTLSNGGFVVVWQSNGQDGSGYGVYGRIFSQ
jgi:hypothetical protein